MNNKKYIFLDRDGVIIEDVGYIKNPSDVKLINKSKESIKLLNDNNIEVIVITNQSGIGRGYYTKQDYCNINKEIIDKLYPAKILDFFYCPHHPKDLCYCRKPSPYLIFKALEYYDIKLTQTFFIGDKISDLECAINAKITPILVKTGYGKKTQHEIKNDYKFNNILTFNNLYEFSKYIIR